MKIIGNSVGAPMPRTDYMQEDPAKSDYLKGREVIARKLEEAVQAAQSAASETLPKTGGTMEGPLDMGGNGLTGLPDPAAQGDAASWGAVQGAVSAHAENQSNPHAVTAAQVGAVEMKKLWENASWNSDFTEQSVSIDAGDCDYIAIDYIVSTVGAHQMQICKVDATGVLCATFGTGNSGDVTGSTWYGAVRKFTVSATAVAFKKAFRNKINSTTATNDEWLKALIPIKIYGIKGVK